MWYVRYTTKERRHLITTVSIRNTNKLYSMIYTGQLALTNVYVHSWILYDPIQGLFPIVKEKCISKPPEIWTVPVLTNPVNKRKESISVYMSTISLGAESLNDYSSHTVRFGYCPGLIQKGLSFALCKAQITVRRWRVFLNCLCCRNIGDTLNIRRFLRKVLIDLNNNDQYKISEQRGSWRKVQKQKWSNLRWTISYTILK
jgi:hypothetical protein